LARAGKANGEGQALICRQWGEKFQKKLKKNQNYLIFLLGPDILRVKVSGQNPDL
jgi:hypothetical protein